MKTQLTMMLAATVLGSSPVAAETCYRLSLSDEALGALLAAPGAARPVLLELLQAQLSSTPQAQDSLVALLGSQLDRALVNRDAAAFRRSLALELAPVCTLASLLATPAAHVPPRIESKAVAPEERMFESATRGAAKGETTDDLLDALREAGRTAFAGDSTRSVGSDATRGDVDPAKAGPMGSPSQTSDETFAAFEHQTVVHENLMRSTENRRLCRKSQDKDERKAEKYSSVSPHCGAILEEVNQACPDLPESNSPRCSERIFQETSRRFAAIKEAHKRAEGISADAPQTRELARLVANATPLFNRAAHVEANRVASYGLYAGPSFQLQDDGDWNGGSEILFRQQTEIFQPGRMQCPNVFLSWCRGYFEASFTTPDEYPSSVKSEDQVPLDVFDSKGRLRVEGGLIAHVNDWVGFELGGGLGSPLGGSSGFSRAEFRGKLGLHLQTLHSDGMLGQLSFGAMHDRSRVYLRGTDNPDTPLVDERTSVESFDRFYVDATALFPNLELGGWRLAGRLSGDWPIDGNEQADIRLSVLFYYPFNKWLDTFKPKLSEPAP